MAPLWRQATPRGARLLRGPLERVAGGPAPPPPTAGTDRGGATAP